ncbi:alpha-hydroxy-acid oxidizing protein [Tepidimonas taiwanensis]|uniref:4-hydroxymandelate oxidase n=1 Tax=Tepidimonas taiwanensis TaxID=307486 RepID=A0A554WZZ5_9BURK|nr:alpha-hydroxy acid oxidase [Tepidimonas taiwanensis]MCX7692168.1 alpha-hydroxy-acid oxidizing protein [Tepidimonas taiwanensis]TSE29162.1 4-hydroxymandelate oxidase [Tepidimonas taiwanensis]UBQ06176.1 alpha-hydroxy-acid oxidizing protein [Tepidimonas taiwanensis]
MTVADTATTRTPSAAASRPGGSLPAAVAAYFFGGAGREETLRANEAAWQRLHLLPRVLRTPAHISTQIQLLDRTWPTPWLAAPMAHLRLAHPHAETGLALASATQGAGMVLSTQATTPLEDVARAVQGEPGRGPLWFQLYPYGTRAQWQQLAQRAADAGYEALVLTVDAPVQWPQTRARAAGFALPTDWPQPNLPAPAPQGTLQSVLAAAPRWEDVAWLRANAPLPLLLKGVLHPDDARTAVDEGLCDGLIVSNHGGRVLDGLPATAAALPAIVAAVRDRVPVLVDGGLRSALDVVRALAMGARGVLIGRPLIAALADGGAQAVASLWRQWRDELGALLALCGVEQPGELHPSLLQSA